MDSQRNDNVTILEDHDQLQKLARVLLNREEPLMVQIESEPERINYLKTVNQAHDKSMSLLAEAKVLRTKYELEGVKADIAKGIEKYIIYAINWAMQCVGNCYMRVTCIDKIKSHFDGLVTELEEVKFDKIDDDDDDVDVDVLAAKVTMYVNYMWEFGNKSRTPYVEVVSKACSMVVKQQGITFSQLINRQKNMLGFKEEFEDLNSKQKLQVYNSTIMNERGRGHFWTSKEIKEGHEDVVADITALVVDATLQLWSPNINNNKPPILNSLKFHPGQIPDGMAIALEIAAGA